MKHYLHIIVSVWIMLFLSACGSSSTKHSPKVEEDNTSISYDNQITENDINTSDLKSYKIEGFAQKGELLDGQVTLYKVDSHGNKAEKVSTVIIQDKGAYQLEFEQKGLYLLSAKGFFFDEYLGEKSSEEIELYALVNIQETLEHININLFTSLQYVRVSELMSKGMLYEDALKQAKNELKKVVGLNENIKASQLDIYDMKGTLKEDNKNLLLFSATFLKIANENASSVAKSKQIRKFSARYSQRFYDDFRDNGKVDGGFEEDYKKIKKADRGATWRRAIQHLSLGEVGEPALAEWARGGLGLVGSGGDIGVVDGGLGGGIIRSNEITEFKFWGTKIDEDQFNYNNQNHTPTVMFIPPSSNRTLLRFTISIKGSGTIKLYAKSGSDRLLFYTKQTSGTNFRSLRLSDVSVTDNLRVFLREHQNISFYATLGTEEKSVTSMPVLAGLSLGMSPNTTIKQATYKGACSNPSNYPLNLNTFDAKMDIEGIYRGDTPVSYHNVCVKLSYQTANTEHGDQYYVSLKSGYYGSLAHPIYRTIGDYNITIEVKDNRVESNEITLQSIKLKLPLEHGIHAELSGERISPRGSSILSLPLPASAKVSKDEKLPTSFSGHLYDHYLHGKNLPLYFRLTDYTLDNLGLKFHNAIPKYVFKDANRFKNNTERFKYPESNPTDIWMRPTGIETTSSIVFDETSFLSSYPKMTIKRGKFSLRVKDSLLKTPSIKKDQKVSLTYDGNCKFTGCADKINTQDINLTHITQTHLYPDGASLLVSDPNSPIGPISWGNNHSKAVFKRLNDQGAKVYIPGFELPTNSPQEIASYLLGTIEEHDGNASYHKVEEQVTQQGGHLFAGINIGNLENEPDGSLENKGMNVYLGGEKFSFETHKYSKYYIRPAGVTGLFNDIKRVYDLIPIYGYDTTFNQFKFRVIQNRVDEFTKIDGKIDLAGKAMFDVAFKNLGIDCRGDLQSGVINTKYATIDAWHTPTEFTTLDFVNNGNNACSATKKLEIGHILKVAALKEKVGAKIQWSSLGIPLGSKISKASFNQLDGNSSKDNKVSNDGYSVEVGNLELASSSQQDWIESNMSVGLPFWGVNNMSVRMENQENNHSLRKPTIITAKGELFGNGRSKEDDVSVLIQKIHSEKYQYDVSKKWAGVFTFGMPIYYDSTEKKIPKFLGRTRKKDLVVMKAKAGINYITPKRTAMSFGASADFEKLKGLKLHIDLNDPKSLKEIDDVLHKYLKLDKPLESTLGELVKNINIGNKLLKDGLSLSMEEVALLALQEAGKANPNDPFDKLAQLNAEVYAIPTMLGERFKSIFVENMDKVFHRNDNNNSNSENNSNAINAEVQDFLRERVKEYRRLVVDINTTKTILHTVINIQGMANQLKGFVNKQAFGSENATCSWSNFSTKGFFKPVGQVANSLKKVNSELQKLNISKITKFAKTASRYSGVDPKELVDMATKIQGLGKDLNSLVNAQDSWIQNSFKPHGLVCGGMSDIDSTLNELYKTLAPFTKVATAIDNNITKMYQILTSPQVQVIVEAMDDVNKFKKELGKDLEQSLSQLGENIENNITQPVLAQVDSMVKIAQSNIPNLSADEMRRMVVTQLFKVDAVHDLIKGIHEQLTPVADELNKLSSILFSGVNKSINKILAKVSSQINEVLAKATSTLDKIPLSTASMDGYSIFYGDQLAQLHIGSEFKIKGKDKESSFSFNAALDVKNNEINGSAGCKGERGKGNLDAVISTRDITMPIGAKKLKVDLILLGVNIENGPKLNGIFGGISSKSGFEFNKFKLYNLGLATGIGSLETYLGAKANATLDDLQLGVSFLVGVVCNQEMIQMVMPKAIYEFITLPGGKFNGAMVFGEAQMPIWVNGCMLTVNARAKLGTWFLFGPPKTFGGIVGGAAFGKGLCIATLGGEIEILAQKSGDNVKFQGSGWGAAGVGWCDNSWSSVRDSRSDSWCGTGDAQFGARYNNGWELMNIKTSAVH